MATHFGSFARGSQPIALFSGYNARAVNLGDVDYMGNDTSVADTSVADPNITSQAGVLDPQGPPMPSAGQVPQTGTTGPATSNGGDANWPGILQNSIQAINSIFGQKQTTGVNLSNMTPQQLQAYQAQLAAQQKLLHPTPPWVWPAVIFGGLALAGGAAYVLTRK